MPEEPEQMLIKNRVATLGRIEEVRIDQAIAGEETTREHHCRHREDDHKGGNELGPDKERQPVERHSRRAHLENSADNDHGPDERGDLRKRDHLRPNIHTFAGRVRRARKRHVRKPACVWSSVQQKACI